MENKEQKEKQYKCEICNRQYTHYGTCYRHIKTHDPAYWHTCEWCKEVFTRTDTFHLHRDKCSKQVSIMPPLEKVPPIKLEAAQTLSTMGISPLAKFRLPAVKIETVLETLSHKRKRSKEIKNSVVQPVAPRTGQPFFQEEDRKSKVTIGIYTKEERKIKIQQYKARQKKKRRITQPSGRQLSARRRIRQINGRFMKKEQPIFT